MRNETESSGGIAGEPVAEPPHSAAPGQLSDEGLKLPIDPWRLLEALRRRRGRLLWGGLALFLAVTILFPKPPAYLAVAHLVRRESTISFTAEHQGIPFKPQVLSTATLAGYMKSPDLLRRVSAQTQPPVSPQELIANLKILPEENPDVITFSIRGQKSPQATADLANLFTREVARLTQEMQSREAKDINGYLKEVLTGLDRESTQIDQELAAFLRRSELFNIEKETDSDLQQRGQVDLNYQNVRIELETLDLKIAALKEEILSQKRGAIDSLLTLYTEAHPIVEEERAQLNTLEKQLASNTNAVLELDSSSPVASGLFQQIIALRVQKIALNKQLEELNHLRERIQQKLAGLSQKSQDYARINDRLHPIQNTRSYLAGRQREAQLFEENPLGYFLPMATVTADDVANVNGAKKALIAGLIAAAIYVFGLGGLILICEIMDDRVKTAADVTRVTQLPLLATLGDIRPMAENDLENWAFRTWTLLAGHLLATPHQTAICGFTSAHSGEGCTTWIDRLAVGAAHRGFRSIRVSTRLVSSSTEAAGPVPLPAGASAQMPAGWDDWLARIGETSARPGFEPVTLSPPPGWTWGLDQLAQWKAAVKRWQAADNLVVLIELPIASEPSAVLLAETLPHTIWLTGSGLARTAETRTQLETLRYVGCHLAGAVLNREPRPFALPTLPRWLTRLTLLAGLACLGANAGETNRTNAAATTLETGAHQFFSVVTPEQRAPWQQKLTLGPGDSLNFSLYRFPDLAQTDVTIGPDGRVSYLQARNIVAAGLTIDELRARLEQELAHYYRNPRLIITPVAFRSKKYFILGAVVNRGVFVLDRPLTIIEAVARAQGLATASSGSHSIVEVSDLSRSFLIRQGNRAAVDFEKLFREGDLTHNIALEPDDYLYFPPSTLNEVYVLGQVRAPGIVDFTPSMTIIRAITLRSGFTPGAYQKKVLVVRGSLRRPESYMVDAEAILAGKSPDFRLQPKDIIFVNRKPWASIGQVLDLAISSYLYAVVVTWTGENMSTLMDHKPYIPGL